MPALLHPPKFLIIDDNGDSRTLLTKALLRKYPNAVIQQCQNSDTATHLVQTERLSAVIAHRTFDYDGETLIRLLRRVGPKVPLVMVSGNDKRLLAGEAGADAFMNYDAWLTIGTVVAEAMASRAGANELPPMAAASDLVEPERV